jgi:hypothetical protein
VLKLSIADYRNGSAVNTIRKDGWNVRESESEREEHIFLECLVVSIADEYALGYRRIHSVNIKSRS